MTVKTLVWVSALLPLGLLGVWALRGELTANPVAFVTAHLGTWALRLLLATLAMTPLRLLTGWGWPALIRRLLGLFAFAYAVLHFGVWVFVDHFFNWGQMAEDLVKRPYITAGLATLALLVPLAATSTRSMIRRLGGQRWKRLHRLVYLAAIGACVHFFWLAKVGRIEPWYYAAALTVLLGVRLGAWGRRVRRSQAAHRVAAGLARLPAGARVPDRRIMR
jgi:sulfoxide reductase heme-binding subunit YedZ